MKTLLKLSVLVIAVTSHAQDRLQIDSRVSGSREQPKVLYVLPWQPPSLQSEQSRPFDTALGDALAAPERDELLLEIELHHISASNPAKKED